MIFQFQTQYLGETGHTMSCLIASDAILESGTLPETATIITYVTDRRSRPIQEEHLFLFWHWPTNRTVTIVPSGFASGYPGEGAKGFSLGICLIRSKSIPIQQISVPSSTFKLIDSGGLTHQLLESLSIQSEQMGYPFSGWILAEHERLLEKDQIWRVCYWRQHEPDWLGVSMARIDEFHEGVGRKLRLVNSQLSSAQETEHYQQTGILIRDSWIEFAQKVTANIDLPDIGLNDVKARVRSLNLADSIRSLATATYDLALKMQHDRRTSESIARSCFINTITGMEMILGVRHDEE